MFCSRCGSQMNERARFCTKCGFELKQGIPRPKAEKTDVNEQQSTPQPLAKQQNKISHRLTFVGVIIIGIVCYLIGSALSSELHHYLNAKTNGYIDTGDTILGIIGYLLILVGGASVLFAVKELIAISKYPPKDS